MYIIAQQIEDMHLISSLKTAAGDLALGLAMHTSEVEDVETATTAPHLMPLPHTLTAYHALICSTQQLLR